MKVVVLGAGIIGISTAWHLLEEGHEVMVVDRQPDAALETSFANGAQISVSFCEPWAHAGAPLKVAKWLLRNDSPAFQHILFFVTGFLLMLNPIDFIWYGFAIYDGWRRLRAWESDYPASGCSMRLRAARAGDRRHPGSRASRRF